MFWLAGGFSLLYFPFRSPCAFTVLTSHGIYEIVKYIKKKDVFRCGSSLENHLIVTGIPLLLYFGESEVLYMNIYAHLKHLLHQSVFSLFNPTHCPPKSSFIPPLAIIFQKFTFP